MDPQLRKEIRWLTTRLGAIIQEQAGKPVFDKIELLRTQAKTIRQHHKQEDIDRIESEVDDLDIPDAYAIAHAFSLFFQIVNLCEERARIRHLQAQTAPAQSLRSLFEELKKAKVTSHQLQSCLDQLQVQPVLTAHPTEAKRRSNIRLILRLNASLENPDEVLETLWQTEEVRERKVSPLNEVENALFFFDRTILEATSQFYSTFDRELKKHYPDVNRNHPFLTFASWIGGDRDGNPYVTPEISTDTVGLQRKSILTHYLRQLSLLMQELTHSVDTTEQRRKTQPPSHREPFQPYELYRRKLYRMIRMLQSGYDSAQSFLKELQEIQRSLFAQNAWRTASGRIQQLIQQVEVFGFHLAELDFRDHSGKLDSAPEEVKSQLQTIRQLQRQHGSLSANHYILSMSRNSSDLARVQQIARKCKLHSLDIVPLFETIQDLENAPGILKELWSDPDYKSHLARRNQVQEVMLGYSDSNKDGGYLAANWFLYRAQKQIAANADSAGVTLRFFHGKGGSIDRGGGQSHRSLRAQPHAAYNSHIRITEQGEVISHKYSNPHIALRNLEQLTSAVVAANCLPNVEDQQAEFPEWEKTLQHLANRSFHHYQALVYHTPEFPEYFQQATPIDLIEHVRIGSRPSRRHQNTEIKSLRAIPWVFAWTQSRHLLPAWYGMGSSMNEWIQTGQNAVAQLRRMYQKWPFFTSIVDNATLSLAKADLYIARQYAGLVKSKEVRDKILGMIESEYRLTVKTILSICQRNRLLANQPVLEESIRLRNPYVDPLNYLQIKFLACWREAPDKKRTEKLRRLLALTVNGIAFGMKSTG